MLARMQRTVPHRQLTCSRNRGGRWCQRFWRFYSQSYKSIYGKQQCADPTSPLSEEVKLTQDIHRDLSCFYISAQTHALLHYLVKVFLFRSHICSIYVWSVRLELIGKTRFLQRNPYTLAIRNDVKLKNILALIAQPLAPTCASVCPPGKSLKQPVIYSSIWYDSEFSVWLQLLKK